MGPVAAPVSPRARQQGMFPALIGLIGVGVLAGGSWFLHERSRAHESASNAAIATASAARPTALSQASPTPATGAIRSVDLDQDSGAARTAAPSNPVAKDAAPSDPVPGSAKGSKLEQPTLAAVSEPAKPTEGAEPTQGAEPEAPLASSADAETTNTAETTTTVAEAPVPAQLPAFDAQAAKSALTASALAASSCRKGDDPRGTAEVIVTFAPSGRITSANVNGAPYGGTATGGCVAATLRSASVPPFAGNHVTVRKLVTIR